MIVCNYLSTAVRQYILNTRCVILMAVLSAVELTYSVVSLCCVMCACVRLQCESEMSVVCILANVIIVY